MAEDPKSDWYQEREQRAQQLKELARQLRDGSDVPVGEQLKRLKALTADINQEPTKPTRADKERMLEELRQKYGDLPRKTLLMKEVGARLKDLRSFSQEMRRASKQDLDGAIIVGDVEEVRRLIAAGVGVTGQSAAGYSLLMPAGIQKQWEIVQVLREAGAKVGLAEAALLGDVDTLHRLLDDGEDVNARHKKSGLTALYWAVSQGRSEAVRLLLERGADINSAGEKGFTPLLCAVLNKQDAMATLLIAAGATVGVVEAALLGDALRLTELLDDGGDIERENTAKMTPLMAAAVGGHTDCVRLLLERGADLHKVNANHFTALDWAISYDRRDTVNFLLDAGMDVNFANQHESEYMRGSTPLRRAIMRQLPEMTQLLIERGARVDVRDARGQTPLHWAAMRCHMEVMRVLLDAGADINAVGAMQMTPLMGVVEHILIKKDMHRDYVLLLLERGADVNARAERNRTALMMAAGRGHAELVKLLLEAGADVHARDAYGSTPLAEATLEGRTQVIALLRQYGARANLFESFLTAALVGQQDVLKALLLPRLWERKPTAP